MLSDLRHSRDFPVDEYDVNRFFKLCHAINKTEFRGRPPRTLRLMLRATEQHVGDKHIWEERGTLEYESDTFDPKIQMSDGSFQTLRIDGLYREVDFNDAGLVIVD